MDKKITSLTVVSWLFGALVVAIGIVNTFWGNDMGFGIFILLLSFAYFFPLHDFLPARLSSTSITAGKIVLGIFIVWAAVGVGELFDKVDLMLQSVSA